MSYLQSYLDRIRGKGNPALADAIHKTVEDIVPQYISNFSFTDHVVSLLVGTNVFILRSDSNCLISTPSTSVFTI